jgi:hypothetical protein
MNYLFIGILLNPLIKRLLPLGLMLIMASCGKEDRPEPPSIPRHNSFSMTLNGTAWQPSQLGPDTCARTYKAKWAEVQTSRGLMPYYTISAYRDPQAAATPQSENAFTLQFTEVLAPGVYSITGGYQHDFESYAVFTINRPNGTFSRYVNKQVNSAFRVEVSEFIPLPVANVAAKGVKGTFSGTLYNENNSSDSLVINRGSFTFMLLGTDVPNYNQCR